MGKLAVTPSQRWKHPQPQDGGTQFPPEEQQMAQPDPPPGVL